MGNWWRQPNFTVYRLLIYLKFVWFVLNGLLSLYNLWFITNKRIYTLKLLISKWIDWNRLWWSQNIFGAKVDQNHWMWELESSWRGIKLKEKWDWDAGELVQWGTMGLAILTSSINIGQYSSRSKVTKTCFIISFKHLS